MAVKNGIDYGVKKRWSLKLHEEGKNILEISIVVGCDKETVRGWIKSEGLQPHLVPKRKRSDHPVGRFAHLK